MQRERIAEAKLFAGLTAAQLERLLAISSEVTYLPSEVIIAAAEPGAHIYFIMHGRVVVELEASRLQQVTPDNLELAILRDGDVFGEISFLEKKPRTARITAIDEVKVLRIPNLELDKIFEEDGRLGYLVMRNLATILSQRLLSIGFRLRDNF